MKGCRANPHVCEAVIGEVLRVYYSMVLVCTKTTISIVYFRCVNFLFEHDEGGGSTVDNIGEGIDELGCIACDDVVLVIK